KFYNPAFCPVYRPHLHTMVNHNWFLATVLLWLLLCYHNLCINAQSQNAIGAHRTFQKTSFSCAGRPSGYYADIETGCQVYHMCDGLGRQFSYSCPNTTLFQQRMLICDHWYMVNCSKAESDYTANLLIGQRDKPFVNDEENSLRTPRPDLLDRPYAPDYSGESFRNQYQKSLSSVLNQIYDHTAQKMKEKTLQAQQNQLGTGQQRWKIPPPSRIILPPAYEPQILEESSAKPSTRTSYYTPTITTTTRKPSTLRPTATTKNQSTKFNNVAALHNRHDEHLQLEHDDLGTSHSTRYNTSADFNSAEDRFAKTPQKATTPRKSTYNSNFNNAFTTAKPTTTTKKTTLNPKIKVPSKIYEPPLLYPIYNMDDNTATTTMRPTFRASTASPFVTRVSATTSTTTTKAPTRPTTVIGKPFTRSSFSTSTKVGTNSNNIDRFDVSKLSKEIRTPAPAQGFKPPTPTPPVKNSRTSQNSTYNKPDRGSVKHEQPSKQLLPPLADFITHDVATTQGPPIYYEWKVPSDGLEPPKLDSPIGVDGREYPETVIDYNSISTNNGFTSISSFGIDQKRSNNTSKSENKTIVPSRSPISRSIKETGQPKGVNETKAKTSNTSPTRASTTTQKSSNPGDIFQIRKELSVPEYAFPLENVGRTGYLDTDVYNSFQLKIPERRADTDEHIHWYGENPKCPECHPSYVRPGTCEPCIRR
ncbi:hypothetical protein FF38_04349, partial [Lucilia cuprina]